MIFNAGRIENNNGNFKFYHEGTSKSICKIMEMMDEERIAVGQKLNLDLISVQDWYKESYSLKGDNLFELISTNPAYSQWPAPKVLSHRYLSEEVPNVLVPVASFGKLLGVQTPIIDCMITLASAINGVDHFKNGRNLDALGFSGMSVEEIIDSI